VSLEGYFINSYNKDVVKCKTNADENEITCELFNPGTSCSASTNGVILYNNVLSYCNEANQISFSSVSKYVTLSNIDASAIYPNIAKGKDTILLKIDNYSVTQYVTDYNDGIYLFLNIIIYKYILKKIKIVWQN